MSRYIVARRHRFVRRHSSTRAALAAVATIILTVVAVTALSPQIARGLDAGVDGEHIYAGISFDDDRSLQRCTWMLPSGAYKLGISPGLLVRERDDTTWRLYECVRDEESTLVWLPDVTNASVAETARSVMRDLVPTIDDGYSPAPFDGLVKTPTWFWVNPVLWRPVSVTASVPTPRGMLSVTTTATPSTLRFQPGDRPNNIVECDGPGWAWVPLAASMAASDCNYEYLDPSFDRPNGVYRARLDVVWEITWRTNTGASGQLPNLRTGSGQPIRVREMHALMEE